MTDRPAILRACYATWRPVPTRKVLQLVFEIPIEQTELAMKMLGVPQHETSTWCAIARLQNGPDNPAAPDQRPPDDAAQGQGKPHQHTEPEAPRQAPKDVPIHKAKPFSSMARSSQLYLKCGHQDFAEWLGVDIEEPHWSDRAEEEAKRRLGIKSKKELDGDELMAVRFDRFMTDFDTRAYRR